MKNWKQTLLTGLLIIAGISLHAQGSPGAIKGQVLNMDNEPVIGATIRITQGGVLIGGTSTDVEGKYVYKPLNAGNYEILVQSQETQSKRINGVEVNPDKTSYVDVKVPANTLGIVVIEDTYIKPVVDNSYVTMKSMNADQFLHSSGDRRDIKAMIVTMSSDISQDDNGDLHVRGGRGDATAFIVDGVRSPNITGVSSLSVENLSVITGGIPAQYGDITSGVIVVTTKDYFSGIRAKHMRENAYNEEQARVKREKAAQLEEERRKKEIEEELRLEKEALEKAALDKKG
jgi:hypothetical protein